jgi:hypothetical protein
VRARNNRGVCPIEEVGAFIIAPSPRRGWTHFTPSVEPKLARGLLCVPLLSRQSRVHVIGTRTNGARWSSNLVQEPSMRASSLALIAAVGIPSAAYSQDSGLVDGRVGSDLSTSPMQPSIGSTGAYRRPLEPGQRAGFAGAVMPGQVVPENVPVFLRPDGGSPALVDGHRVMVGPNSNRMCESSARTEQCGPYCV